MLILSCSKTAGVIPQVHLHCYNTYIIHTFEINPHQLDQVF